MLRIADKEFSSRLFLGTGKFSNNALMKETIVASGSKLITLALKRVALDKPEQDIYGSLQELNLDFLPNTSGAKNAQEAVFAAKLAAEILQTRWIKLEIHPDQRHLMPDPIETLKAAEQLCQLGFTVLPYCHADPILCKQLEDVGCAAVMPLAAPIGSNQGLQTRLFLDMIIEHANVPVIIDAGLGTPSDAMKAMEIGADAVLVNTSIATSNDPIRIARAFAKAVEYGREAFLAGFSEQQIPTPSSPMTEFFNQ